MGGIPPEVDAWIMQPQPETRPTEIFLPIEIGISPVYSWELQQGMWGAFYAVPGSSLVQDCDHTHLTQDEAWACAETMARTLIEERLAC